MSKQITTVGSDFRQEAFYSVNSKQIYECANAYITRGTVDIPGSLDDCLSMFPGVKEIATAIGFYKGSSGASGACGGSNSGSCGGSGGKGYELWTGRASIPELGYLQVNDLYFDEPDTECTLMDEDWLGCLWGTPEAPYSCTCPDIGPKYEAYIKLRLNDASFWNTPVETPVKRAEFVDALQYGRKVSVTIAGDFSIKSGQTANLRINGISGYPYSDTKGYLNGIYYITGVKHVFTSSGTHETALYLSKIAPKGSANPAETQYYS